MMPLNEDIAKAIAEIAEKWIARQNKPYGIPKRKDSILLNPTLGYNPTSWRQFRHRY